MIPGVVSATQHTMILVSGTDTESAGYTITNPAGNPLDAASYGGSWYTALQPLDYSDKWYDAAASPFGSGAVWTASAETLEGSLRSEQWRLFRHDFSLPAGSAIDSATIAYTADNAVTVYLNGNPLDSTDNYASPDHGSVFGTAPDPADQYHHYTHAYQTSFAPVTGQNTLQFVVRNWHNSGSNPSAVLYVATIVYSDEEVAVPEFPSMFLPVGFIIGILGTVLLFRRTAGH